MPSYTLPCPLHTFALCPFYSASLLQIATCVSLDRVLQAWVRSSQHTRQEEPCANLQVRRGLFLVEEDHINNLKYMDKFNTPYINLSIASVICHGLMPLVFCQIKILSSVNSIVSRSCFCFRPDVWNACHIRKLQIKPGLHGASFFTKIQNRYFYVSKVRNKNLGIYNVKLWRHAKSQ